MRTAIIVTSLILLSCVPGSRVHISQLTHAKNYEVVMEEPTASMTEERTTRRFDILSSAVTFEERCQTAMRAAIELNKKFPCDLTSIVLIPATELKTSGIFYARADYATDHKGVLGISGVDPALPGWDWYVSGSERILTEKELSIAKLFFNHINDFPSGECYQQFIL